MLSQGGSGGRSALLNGHFGDGVRAEFNLVREEPGKETKDKHAHNEKSERNLAPKIGVLDGDQIVRKRPVKNVADGAKHVNAADDERAPGCGRDKPAGMLRVSAAPGTEQDKDLTREIGEAWQPASR